jgi:hypothetical protein
MHISQFGASDEPPRRTIYLYLAWFCGGEAANAWSWNECRVRCVTAKGHLTFIKLVRTAWSFDKGEGVAEVGW